MTQWLLAHWFLSLLIGTAVLDLLTLATAGAVLIVWRWRYPNRAARGDSLALGVWHKTAERLRGARWSSLAGAIGASRLVVRALRGWWGLEALLPPAELTWTLCLAFALILLCGLLQGTSWFAQQCLREASTDPWGEHFYLVVTGGRRRTGRRR